MARKRRGKAGKARRILLALMAVPLAYLAAALIGGLAPVNPDWSEPRAGTTIYLSSNGVHTDLVLPVAAEGLDWAPLLPASDVAARPPGARWIAFGMGEKEVYLETPRWRDITPATIWAGLAGGDRVMHVEWVTDPVWSARAIRLRPHEYRRLWSAIRAGFELGPDGRPFRIDHPGYGPADAFYRGVGRANAIETCNQWTASRLLLAGVRAPLWSPFTLALTTRYRPANQRT